jgi:choline-sulfatase
MHEPTRRGASRNLLVICSDEHDPRHLGASGDQRLRTPNIDALAARGTRFERAWTPSPICVPARAAMATGRHVHQCGYWDNAIAYEGRTTSWHHRLAEAGVRVESIGKLHFRREDDPTGFHAQHEAMHIHEGIGLVWGAVREPLPANRGRSPIFDEMGAGLSSYNRYDDRIATLAEQWLRDRPTEPEDRPWALFVGFVAPHMPLVVPQEFLERHLDRRDAFKLHPADGHRRHPWVERMARFWDHDAELGSHDRRVLARACYLGLVEWLDVQVGRVLKVLTDTGLDRDTTVIYTSDHGDNLGARGLWNKSVLYRESLGIPMIVAGPGTPVGRVNRTNVSLVDLYPTALDACAVPLLPEESDLPGRSLRAIAQAGDDASRLGFSEYHAVGADGGAFMVCDGRFKYHHYVGYPPELFDLEEDPEESNDLAGDAGRRHQLGRMEEHLLGLLDPIQVDAAARRDQRDLIARFGGRDKAWSRGNPGPTRTADKYRMA